ncbi:endonuclease/exonuclease/phosphatase family protein [Seonamhaeicola algicola]|uniref:Endonuclease/exonuclease/phosphatase family protein n=1 Tax=Seonamhaeicola algicola TaxID=1719036 RepID=A0A5C7AWX9_9FLAO|nr:endonuclease/exonuclease/phosphatase family protein [Seonamhaeicola algicola]TXE13188.1 endonuclease/exonuclease/phosphatase family protein [Seonamhaeicola algicola]
MKFIKIYALLTVFTLLNTVEAQEKNYKIHTIAFYNLENLFDTINDPTKLDEYSPIMEIKGNRDAIYKQKVKNMAKVLADIGSEKTQNTPSIIGICEVENRKVVEDLVNDTALIKKDYGIIHYDAPDARGIDVGLLYQKSVFKPLNSKTFELKIYDDKTRERVQTRDQLLVSGLLENELIHVIVNHWPSRRGGEARSNPKRVAAAKLNKRIIDSLQTEDPYAKIFIMGDLNDNPTNNSVKKVLNAKENKSNVGLKGIYNPFTTIYKNGLGTVAYRDVWSLFDQIMVTKPLIDTKTQGLKLYKASIFNAQYLINSTGAYKGYPYRSFTKAGFTNGYSDHFPVYIYLIKEIKE